MRLIDADELVEIVNCTLSKPPFSRKTMLNMIEMARTYGNGECGVSVDGNCPLIELPDHGDLIDRDALKEKAHKLPNGYNHGYFHKCVDELFADAPVVIPAERSEE